VPARPRWRGRLDVAGRSFAVNWSNHDLRRAQLSFAAAWTSEWTLVVALSVVAFRDGGAAAVGLVTFLRLVPAALVSPVGTSLADRFPRDRVLRWACVGRAAALSACALAVGLDAPPILAYSCAALATIAFVVFRPAHSALLPSLCHAPVELTSATVVRGLVDSASTLLGPVLAAVVIAVANTAAALGCAAALSLAAGIALTRLSYVPSPVTDRLEHHLRRDALDGFRALPRFPSVFLLIRLAWAQMLTRGCLSVLVVVVAIDVLGVGEAGVGVLTAAIGAGALVGSLVLSLFVRGGRLAVMLGAGVALWGLPLVAIGIVSIRVVVVVALAIVGVGNALVDVGIFTLPARLVPDVVLSRVFGAFESLGALVVAAAALLTPLLLHLVGVHWALVIVGLIGPAYAAVSWGRLRSIDRSVIRRDLEFDLLDRLEMFHPLPMPAIEQLADRLGTEVVEAGRPVVVQGDHGDRFYVIERGTARVVQNGAERRLLGDGDCFGEIALLRDIPRTASVVAASTLRLRTLSRDDFLAAVAGPAAARAAAERVADRWLEGDAP